MYNYTLLELAKWRLNDQMQKSGFVPSGDPSQDPSAGMPGAMAGAGGAPPDPSAMGMDPSAAGGGAPPDASMMSSPTPAPQPDITETIRSIMQQELAKSAPAAGGGGGAGGGGAAGRSARPDIVTVANDIFQVKKILTYLLNLWGIPLPPDVLDGPNRDPSTGLPVPPGTPGSTSDPSQQAAPAGGGGSAGGPQGAFPAIQPVQPAFGGGGGGSTKTSSDNIFQLGVESSEATQSFNSITNRAAALAKLAQSLRLSQGETE